MFHLLGVFSLAFAMAVVGISASSAAGGSDPATEIRTLLPKGAIPAIDEPKFASAKEAEVFMDSGEMVIGIDIGGERRAYSVPLLSSHEIVNDVVGGRKIAVTW